MVCVAIVVGRRIRPVHRFLDQVDDAVRRGVEHRLVELARCDGGNELRIRDAVARRHFEVEAGGKGADAVVHRAPVGDHETVEAPLVAEDAREQPRVLARVHTVDAVVRAHDRPRLGVLDDALEAAEVDLAQRALVDVCAHAHPVGLLVVRGEMLQRSADAARLQSVDEGGTEAAAQDRVLGEVFEVAAAQRGPLDVDAGAEQHANTFGLRLVAERVAESLEELRVPRRSERHRRRKARCRNTVADAEVVAALTLFAHAVGSVGQVDGRDGDAVDSLRLPEALAAGQRRLLLGGQRVGMRERGGHDSPSIRSTNTLHSSVFDWLPVVRPALNTPRARVQSSRLVG